MCQSNRKVSGSSGQSEQTEGRGKYTACTEPMGTESSRIATLGPSVGDAWACG